MIVRSKQNLTKKITKARIKISLLVPDNCLIHANWKVLWIKTFPPLPSFCNGRNENVITFDVNPVIYPIQTNSTCQSVFAIPGLICLKACKYEGKSKNICSSCFDMILQNACMSLRKSGKCDNPTCMPVFLLQFFQLKTCFPLFLKLWLAQPFIMIIMVVIMLIIIIIIKISIRFLECTNILDAY